MRFVETKTCEQQSVLMLHRVRQMQVRQKTMLTNAIRAHLAEFGLVAKIGREGIDELLLLVRNGDERIRRVTDAMASVSLVRSEPAPT